MSAGGGSDLLHDLLRRVTEGERLSRAEAASAIVEVVEGRASEVETAALLAAWKTRGESAEEVAGVVSVLRERMVPVRSAIPGIVDTCGTGGDGFGTFNVSTAAAFVVAGAGIPVAKHGNRAVSSKSGSADVLSALGVPLDLPLDRLADLLAEVGIVFLFAPNHHPAMAKVAPIRRALRLRTIFNIVGPLSNPAGARRQVIGVWRRELLPLVAGALVELGTDHSLVVHGDEGELGLDEITTTGPTLVHEVRGGEVRHFVTTPEEMGFRRVGLAELLGGGAAENAAMIRRILDGEPGAARDVVLANAGAAIWVGGKGADLAGGIALARESIDSGRARECLARLVEVSTSWLRETGR